MDEKKKILITGSLGYLGSALTAYLQQRGLECKGYDIGFFKDCQLYPARDLSVTIGDMRDFSEEYLDDVQVVIHLAAVSNDPFGNLDAAKIYDPTRWYAVRLAKLCKARGIKFIFPSSCSVYGKGFDRYLDESSPLDPQTPYSLNKWQIEEDLKALSSRDFSPIILRLATVFGLSPRMRFDLVVNMLAGMAVAEARIILNSDGKAWRPHVHIQDVCKAFYDAIHFQWQGDQPLIVNVGDDEQNFQISSIAEMVQKRLPSSEIIYLPKIQHAPPTGDMDLVRDRKIQDGVDVRTYKVSFGLIKRTFKGFRCDWSVERGIARMIDELQRLGLSASELKNVNYYRLQKIEYLYQNKLITGDLRWPSRGYEKSHDEENPNSEFVPKKVSA